MSAIGFLNPTLYSVGYNTTVGLNCSYDATFNDVVSGNNSCCGLYSGDNPVCCSTGFTAVKGW
jgi:hypothetical protein